MVTPARAKRVSWAAPIAAVGLLVVLAACWAETESQPLTRVEPLMAHPSVAARPREDAACEFVQREAQRLNASLPKRLDEDTAATRVSARGCDLTLEYQMLNLAAADVAPGGVHAMRARVVEQLCTDTAARATLERGGTFTNRYLDQAREPIGHFTVRRRDCEAAQRSSVL